MRVVIIGAGNVATVFGRLITKANHEIVQVISRNSRNARLLANELGCAFSGDSKFLDTAADLYIVAIADAALSDLSKSYFLQDKLVVHTSGAVSKDILKMVSVNYGVLYPLQSLNKENLAMQQDIPLLIDGSSAKVITMIKNFALSFSSTVATVNDEHRKKLHVAAVIVNNFTNHLYTLAADYCGKEGLDFKMLQPLIEETALRLRTHLPGDMQTGPAIRKDIATVDEHLSLLSSYPALKKVYEEMTESIMHPVRGEESFE